MQAPIRFRAHGRIFKRQLLDNSELYPFVLQNLLEFASDSCHIFFRERGDGVATGHSYLAGLSRSLLNAGIFFWRSGGTSAKNEV